METLEAIFGRKSIRRYTDQPISQEQIETILKAGMAGPSAVNARPWAFIAVTDREMLNKMADCNGRAAEPLRRATLGILVCGDLEKAIPMAKDYWIVDATIAAQNMILAAQAMGIGSCWLGTWPQDNKIHAQAALLELPEHIVPHSLIAFGYPAEDPDRSRKPEWEADKVHYEHW